MPSETVAAKTNAGTHTILTWPLTEGLSSADDVRLNSPLSQEADKKFNY